MERTTDEELALALARMKTRRRVLLAFGGVLSVALFILAVFFVTSEIREQDRREEAMQRAEQQAQDARPASNRTGPVETIPTFAEEIRGTLERRRSNNGGQGAAESSADEAQAAGPDTEDGDEGQDEGRGDHEVSEAGGDSQDRTVTLPRRLRDMDPTPQSEVDAGILVGIQSTLDAMEAARSPADRLAWIRHADLIEGHYIEFHHKDSHGIVIRELHGVRSLEIDGRQFAVADAATDDGQRLQAVFEEVDGRYLLDWESLAHFDPVSWQSFRHPEGPQEADFRVLATLSESYAGIFGNVDYVSLRLQHPRERGILFGYFRRSDPEFSELLEQLERSGETPVPLLVRLSVPDVQARTNQVIIDAVLGDGWVRR